VPPNNPLQRRRTAGAGSFHTEVVRDRTDTSHTRGLRHPARAPDPRSSEWAGRRRCRRPALGTIGGMMRLHLLSLLAPVASVTCASPSPPAAVPSLDDPVVRHAIEAYMECIPEDWLLQDKNGNRVTREHLRANVLRDWSIIPRTLAIETKIDSLQVHGDAATVYTSQRWERHMLRRDGKPKTPFSRRRNIARLGGMPRTAGRPTISRNWAERCGSTVNLTNREHSVLGACVHRG
jgi:hypothetical protein